MILMFMHYICQLQRLLTITFNCQIQIEKTQNGY